MDLHKVTQVACRLWIVATCAVTNLLSCIQVYSMLLGRSRILFRINKLRGIGFVQTRVLAHIQFSILGSIWGIPTMVLEQPCRLVLFLHRHSVVMAQRAVSRLFMYPVWDWQLQFFRRQMKGKRRIISSIFFFLIFIIDCSSCLKLLTTCLRSCVDVFFSLFFICLSPQEGLNLNSAPPRIRDSVSCSTTQSYLAR